MTAKSGRRQVRQAESVTFGGSALDRAAERRGDAAEMARMLADPAARVLPVWRGKPLFGDADLDGLGWLTLDHRVLEHAELKIFLGLDEGAPRFACDVSSWEPGALPPELGGFSDPTRQHHPALAPQQSFAELRGAMTRLTPREAELAATAKAITGWHATHGFCARCGAPSQVAMAGWQRNCGSCGAPHFPRTDPVVIMLILRGNSVLLGRNAAWPEGMYSLLAGFVEPGEPIEAAVRREVFEEAGIRVGRVDYLASQPWPFPMSLMFGCVGEALDAQITVDPVELEDAIWVSREEMMEVFAGNSARLKPARRGAIAHFLISNWLADRLD
jgi:NAD+ diphosphatase